MGRVKEFDKYDEHEACRKVMQGEIYANMIFKKEKSKIENTLLLIFVEMCSITIASILLFDKLPSSIIALLCLMIACWAAWDASIEYQKYKIQ